MKRQELIYDSIIKASLDVIISINEQGRVILWNDAASRTFGYTEYEMLGKSITKIIPQEYRRKHYYGMGMFIRTGKAKLIGKVVEVEGKKKDGSLIPIEMSLSVSKSKRNYMFSAIIRDISERKLFEKKLEDMAIKDSLTGMYNRHYFNEVIDREIARVKRYRYSISVMMIDVDKFKMINDNYGHAQGDSVLKGIAICLGKSMRASDIVIRWGGDEFLIVLPDANGNDLRKIIRKVKKNIVRWSRESGLDFIVRLSIGGCTSNPNKRKDVDELLKEADERLYKDKARNINMK